MDVRELRIGNFVNNKFGELEYSEVKGLGEDYVDLNEITWDHPLPEDIEPIPLTKDWLLKFGVKKIYEKNKDREVLQDCFILKLDYYSEITIETDFSFGVQSTNSDDSVCFQFDIIKSVHQLQNLYFALTGKELQKNG